MMQLQSLFTMLFLVLSCSSAAEIANLTRSQPLKDGDTIVSPSSGGAGFTLGFFTPGRNSSARRYLGIWYGDDPESGRSVVWVANRDTPIPDRTGLLSVAADGNLVLSDANNASIWSTGASIRGGATAILSGEGNLILYRVNGDPNQFHYWQSFDVPTDTFLPGMRVLLGGGYAFQAWKSSDDPSIGTFLITVDPPEAPEIRIWENFLQRRWRSGILETGENRSNRLYELFRSVADDGRVHLSYSPLNATDVLRFRLTWDGKFELLMWNRGRKSWDLTETHPDGDCERYNFCGMFGVCDETGRPKCKCMEGFEPSIQDDWRRGIWANGCQSIKPFPCGDNGITGRGNEGDEFNELRCGKLPDSAIVRNVRSPESCRRTCLEECDCAGYSISSDNVCVYWKLGFVDVVHFNGSSNVLYLRIAGSKPAGRNSTTDLPREGARVDNKRLSSAGIAAIAAGGVVCLAVAVSLICCRSRFRRMRLQADSETLLSDAIKNKAAYSSAAEVIEGSEMSNVDLPLLDFELVAMATDHFSFKNKLGQGGFGPVYKGVLPGGEEIAVKRLSKISGQGFEEFMNEISLIAKLQHRNLVRLLGYSVHEEEKMLIYEYMPNKSLDFFLFDPTKQATLDWRKRLAIIEGVARGLIYLHRDSRLRVIHRDMKASNILLDEEMNPKISDFGMARIFGGNQDEANTNRVVGTYGYMSPEYAMDGLFSVKSDVYSFGVLVLEIVSGRKNRSFRLSDHVNLIGYAWELWSQGRAMEMVDSSIRDSCTEDEMLRCIQVAMLCVQGDPVHRPTMAEVMLMMERNGQSLSMPRQPTFASSNGRSSNVRDVDLDGQVSVSNELTVTMVVGR